MSQATSDAILTGSGARTAGTRHSARLRAL